MPYVSYRRLLNATHMVALEPDRTVFRIPAGEFGAVRFRAPVGREHTVCTIEHGL